jgi:hypothetical protein
VVLTAVLFFRWMTWRLTDTDYLTAQGLRTAVVKFHERRETSTPKRPWS